MARVTPSDPKFDEHFAAVGRIAEAWAYLEFEVDRAIWHLAHVEQMYGACITSHLIGINNRMKAFMALAKLRRASENSIKVLGKLIGELGGMQTKRNRTIHDPRLSNAETDEINRLEITASSSELKFGWRPETIEELKKFRADIEKKVRCFQTIFDTISAEVASLPETARPPLYQIVTSTQAHTVQATVTTERPVRPPASQK